MPIDTSSAAAIVRFSGLGVLCFNGDTAENLFLHEAGHTLTVEIFEPLLERLGNFFIDNPEEGKGLATFRRFPDNPLKGKWYKRLTVYEDLDATQLDTSGVPKEISIKVTGDLNPALSTVEPFEATTTEFVRTDSANDDNDFRWMVNVTREALLGDPLLGCRVSGAVPTNSLLEIKNAVFYTETLATDESGGRLVFKKVENVPSGTPRFDGLPAFGNIADEIGAMIDAAKVKVEVKIGDEVHTHMLPRIAEPYIIYIKNNAAVSGSDMPLYKKLWNTTEPPQTTFDLLTQEEIDLLSGSATITGREFCSGIFAECPSTVGDF
jgi:hypothetical protein